MDQKTVYYELLWSERGRTRLLNGEMLELRRQQGEVCCDAVRPFDC